MGQNGAGKSTIFQLIVGTLKPDLGTISTNNNLTVATAKQVISRSDEINRKGIFEKCFNKKYMTLTRGLMPRLK